MTEHSCLHTPSTTWSSAAKHLQLYRGRSCSVHQAGDKRDVDLIGGLLVTKDWNAGHPGRGRCAQGQLMMFCVDEMTLLHSLVVAAGRHTTLPISPHQLCRVCTDFKVAECCMRHLTTVCPLLSVDRPSNYWMATARSLLTIAIGLGPTNLCVYHAYHARQRSTTPKGRPDSGEHLICISRHR